MRFLNQSAETNAVRLQQTNSDARTSRKSRRGRRSVGLEFLGNSELGHKMECPRV